ncbi:MAG: DUF4446 family protein [Bacillota bacterium]
MDLEAILRAIEERLRRSDDGVEDLRRCRQEPPAHLDRCYQGLGVVRFNAFQGVGSDLSFTVAFLDGRKDGGVISSLSGRDESRVYAKPWQSGQSACQLTAEEKDAVRLPSAERTKASGRPEKPENDPG